MRISSPAQGAAWSKAEVLAVKAKMRQTFGFKNKKVLSSLALISLGLPDETEDQTLYHFGTLHSASKVLRLGKLCTNIRVGFTHI